MAEFERSGGRSTDALWCIYYRDDRSNEVIDFLQRWLKAAPRESAREIETVLAEWRIDSDPIPFHWPKDGYIQKLPASYFAPPLVALRESDDELASDVHDEHPIRQAQAALALTMRGVRMQEAIVALLQRYEADAPASDTRRSSDSVATEQALRWILEYSGTTGARARAGLLENAEMSLDLRRIAASSWPRGDDSKRTRAMLPALTSAAQRTDELGRVAWQHLLDAAGLIEWGNEESLFHRAGARAAIEDRALSDAIASAGAERLRAAIAQQRTTAASIDRIAAIAVHDPALATALPPLLDPLLDCRDEIGDAAMRALCHLGASSDRMRARYLEVLGRLAKHAPTDAHRIPCWVNHDARTLETLANVFHATEKKSLFIPALAAGDLADCTTSVLARELVSWLDARDDESRSWHEMSELGFRALELEPGNTRAVHACKRIMQVRTKRERGLPVGAEAAELMALLQRPYDDADGAGGPNDEREICIGEMPRIGLATREYVDLCIQIVLDARTITHPFDACLALQHVDLDRRQQALLCRMGDWASDRDSWSRLFARQGRASIERAARMRDLAHEHLDIDLLADVLECARPASRDLDLLCAALERGPARVREKSLEIIDQHDIDTAVIRGLVLRAQSDCDDYVGDAARRIVRLRHW